MTFSEETLRCFEIFLLVAAHLFSWPAMIHALLSKRDPRSALGWIAAAFFLPGVGALLYFSIGINRRDSRVAKLMRRHAAEADDETNLRRRTAGDLPYTVAVSNETLPARFHLAGIGRRVTGKGLTAGNKLTPLFNGEEAYPAMLSAIRAAREEVFFSTYIFNRGKTAEDFCRALLDAAGRGADVRVLVDGIGSLYSLNAPWRALKKQGIRVERFLPPRFPFQLSVNLRNHRKILVCDSESAFTGGMNISDNHLASLPLPKRIRDVHFHCRGSFVEQLREAFLRDWNFVTGDYGKAGPRCRDIGGPSLCRLLPEGPGTSTDTLNDVLCAAIAGAKRRIRLMTPYFLPSHEIFGSLRGAALRGVDIRLALPETNNLPYVYWATRRLLPQLLQVGADVRLQPGAFVHTKLLLIDNAYAQIGSANMDSRSLRLNFELNVEVFDTAFVKNMADFFDRNFLAGVPVRLEELERASFLPRLRDAVCWLFSPYL